MQLAPVVKKGPQYTDEERAVIAGYLLKMRQGILRAIASTERGVAMEEQIGLDKQLVYWQMVEFGNRWELYWIGYPVNRNRMYGEAPALPR